MILRLTKFKLKELTICRLLTRPNLQLFARQTTWSLQYHNCRNWKPWHPILSFQLVDVLHRLFRPRKTLLWKIIDTKWKCQYFNFNEQMQVLGISIFFVLWDKIKEKNQWRLVTLIHFIYWNHFEVYVNILYDTDILYFDKEMIITIN